MRLHFRTVKDIGIIPLHAFLTLTMKTPLLRRSVLRVAGLFGKLYYFVPFSYVRRVLRDFCVVAERDDARRIYMDMVDKVVWAGDQFGRLISGDLDALAGLAEFEPTCAARVQDTLAGGRGGIVALPHCPGSMLSGVRFGLTCPTVLLVRESRNPRRSQLNRKYYEKLGTEVLYVGREGFLASARGLLVALKSGKFLIGTTDRPWKRKPDMVEVRFFGQPVWLPVWPAKFSAKVKAPILPTFIRLSNGRITMHCDEPYVADDALEATQRWVTYLERNIRESPSDWFFMFEKRWACILAAAAVATRAQSSAAQ